MTSDLPEPSRMARAVVFGTAALVVAGAIGSLVWSFSADSAGDADLVKPTPSAVVAEPQPGPAPGLPPVAEFGGTGPQNRMLDESYEKCARALGFDPGGVQVLVDTSGRPMWVKTGRDVPAAVHRPCFQVVGGNDPFQSSHGNR
jgi:hypothetical protein